jgi:hypothetical protein
MTDAKTSKQREHFRTGFNRSAQARIVIRKRFLAGFKQNVVNRSEKKVRDGALAVRGEFEKYILPRDKRREGFIKRRRTAVITRTVLEEFSGNLFQRWFLA